MLQRDVEWDERQVFFFFSFFFLLFFGIGWGKIILGAKTTVGQRVGLAMGGYWALIDLQRAGTFKRLADVYLQGQCFDQWTWALVKCLKMRDLWLPWEGSKDLALAY